MKVVSPIFSDKKALHLAYFMGFALPELVTLG